MVKGYTQTYGIDYLETFAPVAKMNTIRILLSLATNRRWSLQQIDIKNVRVITLFVKHSTSGRVTVLLVYANDIVVTGGDLQGMNALKRCLLQEFEVKQLGRLKYFLGIEVAHPRHGIFIPQ